MGPAVVAKVVLPIALVIGGGVAFAASSGGSTSTEVRAWVDSPLDGGTVAAGEVAVRVHATAGGAAVDEIELLVDGDVVGSVDDPAAFGRLATGEVGWTAEVGEHELVARAHVGARTTDSTTSHVLVVDELPAIPPLGAGPAGGPAATTTTTADTTTTTTSIATTTTTTAPPTTTTTEAPLPDPPTIQRLTHDPSRGTPATELAITALVTAPDPTTTKVTIEARQAGADWTIVGVCTDVTEPCRVTGRFGDGVWRYRAIAEDASGQSVTAGDDDAHQFEIFG